MESTNIIRSCRLCLKGLHGSFKAINDIVQCNLNSLQLYLSLAISEEPIICHVCEENLQYCLDFKAKCIQSEDGIDSIMFNENKMKKGVQNIVKNEIVQTNADDLSGYNLCRFCLKEIDCDSRACLDDDDLDMLLKYFPELNPDIAQKSTVCMVCYKSLQRHLGFIKCCLQTEERILEYCRVESTNCKGQVELSNVTNFISKNIIKMENSSCILKVEELSIETGGNMDINSELKGEIKEEIIIKSEDVVEPKIEPTESNSYQENSSTTQSTYKRSSSHNTEKAPLRQHKSSSSTIMYSCNSCPFKTKSKVYLREHKILHKSPDEVTMHRCQFCQYQSKLKSRLRKHLVVHKSKSEVAMHKCTECSYETKYKHHIRRHSLIHKSKKSVHKKIKKSTPMHKCTMCNFKTKEEGSLRDHLLAHRNGLEPEANKCYFCSFEAKSRSNLLKHLVIHKSKSELTMHKCTECSFETKHKHYLPTHMRKYHLQEYQMKVESDLGEGLPKDDCSEKNVYECSDCSFQTKHKRYLQKHSIIHKSGVATYKCTQCNFHTVHKNNIQKHMIIHKGSGEVDTHKCANCDFETKYKRNLQKHMLIHRSSSEVDMLKCSECEFETRHLRSLTRHILVHQSGSLATMHKCAQCGFQTKHKNNLGKHIAAHRKYSLANRNVE